MPQPGELVRLEGYGKLYIREALLHELGKAADW